MYESPIELVTTNLITKMAQFQNEQIYSAIQGVGVNVDKNELLKALIYDRQQYQKGYEDGIEEGMKRFAEIVKKEMSFWMYDFEYCSEQMEALSRIDELIKERFGGIDD